MDVPVKKLSRKKVIQIAKLYVTQPVTIEDLGKSLDYSREAISNILFRGVAENIYSDYLADLVMGKVLKHYHSRKTLLRWEKAEELRLEAKKNNSKG